MKRRGFSFLETLLALSILFLVSLYCMSMFAQGQRHWLRAQEYSTAVLLANREVQELLAVPFAMLPASGTTDRFEAPFEDYVYGLTIEPYDTDMSLLRVQVTSRKGVQARVRTLVADNERFFGIAANPSTHYVAFAQSRTVTTFDDETTPTVQTPPRADIPGGGPVAAVAGEPGSGLLWASAYPAGLHKLLEDPAPGAWGGLISLPTAGVPARCTGLAATPTGDRVYVADSTNRAIWLYRDDEEGATWHPTPLRPQDPPLGAPAGLTVDPYGSVLWVADREFQCLRKLLLVEGSPGPPAADLEPVSGIGFWQKTRFRPPANVGLLGSPQGIAMDPGGSGVLVVDRARLYSFTEAETPAWRAVATFKQALVEAGPSGVAVDAFQNVAFVSTRTGAIWRVDLATGDNDPISL